MPYEQENFDNNYAETGTNIKLDNIIYGIDNKPTTKTQKNQINIIMKKSVYMNHSNRYEYGKKIIK